MLFALNAAGVPSTATWVRLDPAAPDAPGIPSPPPAAPATPAGAIPGDVSAPALSPTGQPAPVTPARPATTALTVRVPAPRLASLRATRVRVTQPVRSNTAARATITVARANGRVVARRTVRLAAGRTSTQVLTVSRARLAGSPRLRVRVVVTDASRRTRSTTHVARVPPARR